MSCWLCDAWGPDADHDDSVHHVILDWHAHWAGSAGWARKQAILQAKRDAKAMLKPKKLPKG